MKENLEIVQGPEPAVPFFGEAAERFRHRFEWSYQQAGSYGRGVLEAAAQILPLGDGAEKIVYRFGPDKVVSLLAPYSPDTANKDYSPDGLKRTFYQRKLLHLLVPDCVPDIHMAGTSPPMLVLERVEKPIGRAEFLEAIELRNQKLKNGKGKDPQSSLFALGVNIDPGSGNNILDVNGNTVYVDNPIWKMDKDVLQKAIVELPEPMRRKALKYMDRLESLGAWSIDAEEVAEMEDMELVA